MTVLKTNMFLVGAASTIPIIEKNFRKRFGKTRLLKLLRNMSTVVGICVIEKRGIWLWRVCANWLMANLGIMCFEILRKLGNFRQ